MLNIVAWSITFEWEINIKKLWINYVLTKTKNGFWNIFVYWETKLKTSDEVVKFIQNRIIGTISKYDISISTEDNIILKVDEQIMWSYECNIIEWADADINSVLKNVSDEPNVIAVREAEKSKIHWNRIIKVDKII